MLAGESCSSSADCNPNQYCNSATSICTAALPSGAACTSSDTCSMGMVCYFTSNTATTGTCAPYFSLATSSPVYANTA
jgi:hypothetical protein